MSITAAQLVAEVTINGADSGISNLTQLGAVSDGTQAALDRTSSAADALSQVFAAQQQAISADGEAYMSLQSILAETDSYLTEQISAVTSDGEAVVSLGTVMADLAAQADATAMQIAAESEAEAQAASNSAYLAMTAGQVAPALEETASAATNAAASVSEAGTAATESGGGFMDMAGKVGMGLFALQGLISMAGQVASALFAPAISAEEVSSSLVIFTGSAAAAQKELQQLSDFASHTPFETATIDDAALKLQAVGINAKDVIPDILALGDALDATGRISSADLEMIVNDFSKIKTEGHLTTDVMNSFALQGIDAWSVLEKQTGKTHAELAKLISSGLYPADKAMKDLTAGIEKSPLYKGQMANDVANFTGAVSTMKSNFDQVLVSFASPILKAIEPVINNISAAFSSQGFKDFAGGIGKGIANVFSDIATFVGRVAPPLDAIGHIIANNLAPAFSQLNTVFAPFAGVFSHIADLMPKAHSGFKSIYDDLGPLAPLAKALVDGSKELGDALAGLGKNKEVAGFISSLRDGFSQLQKIVGGELGKDFQTLGKTVQDLGKWFQTTMMPAIQQAMPGFEHLGSVIATTVVPALAKIWAVGDQLARQALPPLIKAFETIGPIVVKVGGFLADNLGKALQFIMPFAVQAAQEIGKFASEIGTRVVPIVQQMYDAIKIFLDWIGPYWPTIWDTIKSVMASAWDTMKGVVQIAWSIISGIIKVGLDIMSGNWGQAWTDVKDMLGGILSGIQSMIQGLWDLVGGMVSKALGAADKGKIQAEAMQTEMQLHAVNSAMATTAGVIKHADLMRQGILKQLAETKDPKKRAELEMQLAAITAKEDEAKKILDAEKKKKEGILKHLADLKAQSDEANKSIVQQALDHMGQWKDQATAKMGEIVNAIHGKLTDLKNTVGGWFSSFGSFWHDRWTDISNAVGTIFNGIAGGVRTAFNTVIDIINNFIRSLDNLHISLPGGGSIGFSIPTIPHLAAGGRLTQGGVVELGERGSEQVYLPAGAEVVPHGQSFGGQQPVIVQAILEIDGQRVTSALMPHIASAIRYRVGTFGM